MTNNELKEILYAEDEPDIRAIAKIALEDIGGFSVKYCNSGKQVLKEITECEPDLILLDVMMPEMDGPTTLKELRKIPKFENIPVIFMTAKIQASEIADYKAMGVAEVINKPFDPMTLSEIIKKTWKNLS